MESSGPVVAIIGPPNVGKSTLFNRLIGRRQAIVDREKGITRDRQYARLSHRKRTFQLIDTGGMDVGRKDRLARQVLNQARAAVAEAGLVLLVTDVKEGITSLEEDITAALRRSARPVILVVNKVDNRRLLEEVTEFYRLGLGEPVAISALHGTGIRELLDRVAAELATAGKYEPPEAIRVAVVGRPNVGKSSFVNCLLREERVIVDETPGTTRDSIDTYFEEGKERYVLVDTAGMRHRRKLKKAVEIYSVSRTKKSIENAQVVLILIDAEAGLAVDDVRILASVREAVKPAILVVNKWDKITDARMSDYKYWLRRRLKFLDFVPVVFTSCLTGRNVTKTIRLAADIKHRSEQKLGTGVLNRALAEAVKNNPPPAGRGKIPRMYYLTQTGVVPITFRIFVNDTRLFKASYLSYLESYFRKRLKLKNLPIKLELIRRRREKRQ